MVNQSVDVRQPPAVDRLLDELSPIPGVAQLAQFGAQIRSVVLQWPSHAPEYHDNSRPVARSICALEAVPAPLKGWGHVKQVL